MQYNTTRNHIVILPQSRISSQNLAEEQEMIQLVQNFDHNVMTFCREEKTFAFFKKWSNFSEKKVFLSLDTAFYMNYREFMPDYQPGNGTGYLFDTNLLSNDRTDPKLCEINEKSSVSVTNYNFVNNRNNNSNDIKNDNSDNDNNSRNSKNKKKNNNNNNNNIIKFKKALSQKYDSSFLSITNVTENLGLEAINVDIAREVSKRSNFRDIPLIQKTVIEILEYMNDYEEIYTNRIQICIYASLLNKTVRCFDNEHENSKAVFQYSLQNKFPKSSFEYNNCRVPHSNGSETKNEKDDNDDDDDDNSSNNEAINDNENENDRKDSVVDDDNDDADNSKVENINDKFNSTNDNEDNNDNDNDNENDNSHKQSKDKKVRSKRANITLVKPQQQKKEVLDLKAYLKNYEHQHIVFIPNEGNGGDALIACSEYHIFQKFNITYTLGLYYLTYENQLLIYGGGGNLDGHHHHAKIFLEKNMPKKLGNKIILLPHTIRQEDQLMEHLENNVLIFCREKISFQYVRSLSRFPDNVFLSRDMAFYFDQLPINSASKAQPQRREDVRGYFFRRDEQQTAELGPSSNVDLTAILNYDSTMRDREKVCSTVNDIFIFLNRYDEIFSNRLQICIYASLLGKKVHCFPNSYYKNKAVFDYSIRSKFPKSVFKTKLPPSSSRRLTKLKSERTKFKRDIEMT
eukprot:Awhi_evm1s8682